MQNEWRIKMPYTDRDAVIGTADTDLSVEIKDERYTVVVARYRMAAVGDRFYTLSAAVGMEALLDSGEGKGYAVADIDFNDPQRRRYLSCDSHGAPYEYYMCERREDLYGPIGKRMK